MTSAQRKMFASSAVAIFCFLTVTHSAPLDCGDLVRSSDQHDRHRLEGRWALVAGTFSNPENLEFFKRRDSSSIDFSSSNETSRVFYTPSVFIDGKCHSKLFNVSLNGSSLIFQPGVQVNFSVTFLHTSCPDCVVIRFDYTSEPHRLLLLSRRREVEQKEMEEFKAQGDCLEMLPPAVMDPTKELCPEKTASGSAAAAAATPTENEQR